MQSLPLAVPPLAVLQQVERSKQRGPLRCCWRRDWWSPLSCVSSKHTHSITMSYVLAMSWLKKFDLMYFILSRISVIACMLLRLLCAELKRNGSSIIEMELHVHVYPFVYRFKGWTFEYFVFIHIFFCSWDQYLELFTCRTCNGYVNMTQLSLRWNRVWKEPDTFPSPAGVYH